MVKRLIIILFLIISNLFSQQVIDGIAAIVSDQIILKSEVQQYALIQAQQMGIQNRDRFEKLINNSLEQLISNKLILKQAQIDTIEAEDRRVDQMLDQRIENLKSQAGGEAALEQEFGKSIFQIKEDYRPRIREQIIIQKYQQQELSNVSITRREVENFYKEYKDSIGTIPPSYTFGQILIEVKSGTQEISQVKEKADSIYNLLQKGADFEELAKKYSEDPATSEYGGDLGYTQRGNFVQRFEKTAFSMQEGNISPPVRTQFGYHIIKLVDRKGEKVHTKHILFKLKKSQKNYQESLEKAEKVRNMIVNNKISFDSAAVEFSDYKDVYVNRGIVNRVPKDEINNPDIVNTLDTLEIGEVSSVFRNDMGYNIIKLIDVHDDKWSRIKEYALNIKKQKRYQEHINELRQKFYINKYGVR
ncbi:MAG: peptidylprolyl isomerase [Candidatus Marinimicrobia bacterium]|nr:peptidylprolyl isomerase [Candidatus Neomarinimicrobiota bacterium]